MRMRALTAGVRAPEDRNFLDQAVDPLELGGEASR